MIFNTVGIYLLNSYLKKAGKKLAGFVCKARQIHIIKSLIVSVFL